MNNKMAITTYLSTTESEKQTSRTETRYRQHLMAARWKGVRGWVKKEKGVRSPDW